MNFLYEKLNVNFIRLCMYVRSVIICEIIQVLKSKNVVYINYVAISYKLAFFFHAGSQMYVAA